MADKLSKFGILLIVIGAMNLSLFAQEKSCNLKFEIYEFKKDGTSEQFPIQDAKIKLVNEKTKKSIKVKDNSVANLANGDYQLTVAKDGFKKTTDNFLFDCEFANEHNTVSKIMFLWKGNSKETFSMNPKVYGTTGLIRAESKENKNQENIGAILLVKPEYPKAARAVRASGKVEVQVTINELGYVISAKAISGHPLFWSAATEAAKKSKFRTTTLEGIPVKVTGVIVYNFAP